MFKKESVLNKNIVASVTIEQRKRKINLGLIFIVIISSVLINVLIEFVFHQLDQLDIESLGGIYRETSALANVWYVRPEGGTYGSENGTSYDNAWDGFDAVVWGSGGVQAGDTLYVCGTHIRRVTSNNYIAAQGNIIPGASGTSANPIIISGNCSGDNAIIWGAWEDGRSGGIVPGNWEEDENGTYYNISASNYNRVYDDNGLFENIDGLNYDQYTEMTSAEEVINSSDSGVYFMQNSRDPEYINRTEIWIKPFNESTFAENIRWSGVAGWEIALPENNYYIEFQDLKIMAGGIGHETSGATAGPYHDITFRGCAFYGLETAYLYTPYNSYNITIDDCEFAYGGNGIYIIWDHGNNHNIIITNSYFHDIGSAFGPTNADGHGIGVQNNEYIYITNNRFERCGSAICFHVGESQTMKHFYIENNFINDMRDDYGIDDGAGIIISGDNDNPKGSCEDMIIKNNIITNCNAIGIGSNRKDYVEIYNNIVQNCTPNYNILGNRLDGASGKAYNNISLNPELFYYASNPSFLFNYPLHFYFRQNYMDIVYDFEGDYNLYYPNAEEEKAFHYYAGGTDVVGSTFSDWKQGHTNYGDTVDANALTTDPQFVNSSHGYSQAADFQLQWSSPAIDAGIEISSRTSDYYGNPIYGTPDIGAIEYQPPYIMGTNQPDIGGHVRVYGDGKFRNTSNPSGTTANLSIIPSSNNTAHWLDVDIESWTSALKWWTENSTTLGSNTTAHTVGGLTANSSYDVYVNSARGSNITGCTDGICQADSQGQIAFTYTGGYSEVTFEVKPSSETASEPEPGAGGSGGGTLPPTTTSTSPESESKPEIEPELEPETEPEPKPESELTPLSPTQTGLLYPDGAVVTTEETDKIYFIANKKKYWLTTVDVFLSYGLTPYSEINITQEDLDAYEEGPTLTEPSFPEGTLVKAKDDYKIYILKPPYKRHIFNPDIFNLYGHLNWFNIKEIDRDVLDSYITSDLYKAVNDYKVYSLEEINEALGKAIKHHLNISTERFNELGYKWNQIFQINQSENDYYETGSNWE